MASEIKLSLVKQIRVLTNGFYTDGFRCRFFDSCSLTHHLFSTIIQSTSAKCLYISKLDSLYIGEDFINNNTKIKKWTLMISLQHNVHSTQVDSRIMHYTPYNVTVPKMHSVLYNIKQLFTITNFMQLVYIQ